MRAELVHARAPVLPEQPRREEALGKLRSKEREVLPFDRVSLAWLQAFAGQTTCSSKSLSRK